MQKRNICVIGLGYIGLPTSALMANRDYLAGLCSRITTKSLSLMILQKKSIAVICSKMI